jgi:hypothetical protein
MRKACAARASLNYIQNVINFLFLSPAEGGAIVHKASIVATVARIGV